MGGLSGIGRDLAGRSEYLLPPACRLVLAMRTLPTFESILAHRYTQLGCERCSLENLAQCNRCRNALSFSGLQT